MISTHEAKQSVINQTHRQTYAREHPQGKVITLRSNSRWCSEGIEIRCWNREVVRVMFVLDTCDREVIELEATAGGFKGETIRNLMFLSLYKCFGQNQTPHPVQWLTYNGSAFTAKEAIEFGK